MKRMLRATWVRVLIPTTGRTGESSESGWEMKAEAPFELYTYNDPCLNPQNKNFVLFSPSEPLYTVHQTGGEGVCSLSGWGGWGSTGYQACS